MTHDPSNRTAGNPRMLTAAGDYHGVAGTARSTERSPAEQTADPLYSVRLERDDGSTRTVVVNGMDIAREHTQLSDWQATAPADKSLEAWRFSDVEVRYRGEPLFRGDLTEVRTQEAAAETRLAGYGPGSALRYGTIEVDFTDLTLTQAIEHVWNRWTPYDALVLPPDEPKARDEIAESGTPLEVLETLHNDAGMRFYFAITGGDGPDVYSFHPGDIVRPGTWTRTDHERAYEVDAYANHVVVRGAWDSDRGQRYRGEARDPDEIERWGKTDPWPVNRPTIRSDDDAEQVAEQLLRERVAEDDLTGSIDIVPRILPPGVRYEVPAFDGAVKDVETVGYTESFGEASGSVAFERPYSPAEDAAETEQELESTKEAIR